MPKGLRKIVCALLVAGVAGGVIRGEQAAGRSRCGCSDPVGSGCSGQDPESNKVVDFVADRAYPIPYGDTTATVLVGHFAAQHNGAVITCDSAIRYNDKRIECFGNVLINKKETYIYGDRADYNGEINEARVYAPAGEGRRWGCDAEQLDDFRFNTLDNIGTFSGGGMLTNRENHLESDRGYYYADTHQIICVDRVEMRNDKYELKGDSVVYDTDTDQVYFFERTNIWNEGGDYIYADRGRYEKPRELYVLTRNGYVMTEKAVEAVERQPRLLPGVRACSFVPEYPDRRRRAQSARFRRLRRILEGAGQCSAHAADLRWSATIRVRAIRSICVPIRCFFNTDLEERAGTCRFVGEGEGKGGRFSGRL